MRTTISIDDHLLAELKQKASSSGSTVSRLIEEAVRLSLQSRADAGIPEFTLVTFGKGGVFPGKIPSAAHLQELDDLEAYEGRFHSGQ